MKTKRKWKMTALIMITIIMSTYLSVAAPPVVSSSKTAATTYYDYKWWSLATIRNRIDSNFASSSLSYGEKSLVAKFTNNTKKKQNYQYSYNYTLKGTFNLGVKVPVKAIELTAGGSISWHTAKTYSANVTVPPKKTYKVYLRDATETRKYYSKVQRQDLYIFLKKSPAWVNIGAPSSTTSTTKSKFPNIIIS